MLLNFIKFFTMRFYLKGFYRLLWLFKGILRRKDDIYVLPSAPNQLKIKLNHKHYYQWMMASTNYYGFGVRGVMERLLKPGDIFADVGANIGYISLFARSLVGPEGFIIAFEPDPKAITLYKGNMVLNSIENYALIEKV
ncbi:MAG: FkbM family methyltransferase, partial [Pseudomonadota bacterium]